MEKVPFPVFALAWAILIISIPVAIYLGFFSGEFQRKNTFLTIVYGIQLVVALPIAAELYYKFRGEMVANSSAE